MLELKYINLLSLRLRNYKRKGNILNFSCPLCGDSETKKSKARAYVYQKNGKWFYHCHNNCGSMTAAAFIKAMDAGLYSEYIMESMKENRSEKDIDLHKFVAKMKPTNFSESNILKGLNKVSQLSPSHPVKKFVVKRKIPNSFHSILYACPNFMEFTNKWIPYKFSENALNHDEMKLLIPFVSPSQELFAYQGRSLRKDADVRYISIILNEIYPKIYGLDRVNFNKKVFVFEGPIDSMFIPNSLAMAGNFGDLNRYNKDNLIIVYDNEPRAKETIKKIDKSINMGYNVCIWPKNIQEKDVNDMILSGKTAEWIEHTILDNTYSDLKAKLVLQQWSRI